MVLLTRNTHKSTKSQDNRISKFFILLHSPTPDVQALL